RLVERVADAAHEAVALAVLVLAEHAVEEAVLLEELVALDAEPGRAGDDAERRGRDGAGGRQLGERAAAGEHVAGAGRGVGDAVADLALLDLPYPRPHADHP